MAGPLLVVDVGCHQSPAGRPAMAPVGAFLMAWFARQ